MERQIKKITSEKVVVTSFVVSVSDVVMNIVLAIITGSVVMLSQALEGIADLITAGFLLVGVKRAKLPSDREHPFGYGRELYFWTFLAALIIFTITASASFYFGYKRYFNPEPISNLPLAYAALILAIFSNGYSMSLSLKRLLGTRKIKAVWQTFTDSALIETKTVFVIDLMGTTASFLGLSSLILYQISGNIRFDGIGGMIIGLTLAVLALFIIKGARDLLIGQAASAETEEKIIKAAETDPNVRKVLDLRTLQIGNNKLLVNMEIHLADEMETDEIEVLIDKIETEIRKQVPSATNIQIELETPDVEKIHPD